MSAHNFSQLSPYDFEELVADLLHAEWGIRFQSFTKGRDGGIDLRYIAPKDQTIIVQCKHFPDSKFQQLHSRLKKDELPKIQTLRPSRYVLVTSVGLTPANKDALVKLFSPYILNSNDVLGRNDLNDLLRAHSEVERQNYKLWLTSSAVMERVLHNAEHTQTEFEIARIQRKLPLFVQSNALPRAQKILDENRVLIISGMPGIGKTTLADLLLYAHVEQGYEPVVIQEGLADARKLFNRKSKQIFYFDDFLGQTFLEDRVDFLSNNQDAALTKFITAIQDTEYSRFILTTREHILKMALNTSERFSQATVFANKCVLEISDYSPSQRARILYNHVYFSDLPREYIQAILYQEFFFKIIKHRNFTPRLIEWLSSFARVKQVPPPNYQKYILNLLDKPEEIWRYAFEHQIKEASRSILIALESIGGIAALTNLEIVWEKLHTHKANKHNFQTSSRDFRDALNELEGSFIAISLMPIMSRREVSFLNPSVRDFIQSLYCTDHTVANVVLEAATRFSQIIHIKQLATSKSNCSLSVYVDHHNPTFLNAIRQVLFSPELDPNHRSLHVFSQLDAALETRLIWLIQWAEEVKSVAILDLVHQLVDYLIETLNQKRELDIISTIEIIHALDKANWIASQNPADIQTSLLARVLEKMEGASTSQWERLLEYKVRAPIWTEENERVLTSALDEYCKKRVFNEIYNCSSDDEFRQLQDQLLYLQTEYNLRLGNAINTLEQEMEEYGNSSDSGDDYRDLDFKEARSSERMDDDHIRDLFSTLNG